MAMSAIRPDISAGPRLRSSRPAKRSGLQRSSPVASAPTAGIARASAQKADTFGKCACQKCGRTSGKIAIDSRIPTKGSAQISYEIQPSYSAFVRCGVNSSDYDDDVDDNGINRNNYGYDVVGGAEIDFNGIVFGDFFAGYTSTTREDDTLDDFSGFSVGADITWNVTRLTTVTGTVAREIRDTTLNRASGSFVTTVGLVVDHELLRNLIVSVNASGEQNDYEGNDRTDYGPQ